MRSVFQFIVVRLNLELVEKSVLLISKLMSGHSRVERRNSQVANIRKGGFLSVNFQYDKLIELTTGGIIPWGGGYPWYSG